MSTKRSSDWLPELKSFALPLLTGIFFSLFFASSVPSPFFLVFQHRWGFSSGILTLAFGSYAIILLILLMIAGSLSDHVGRRPVIITALVIQVASMILFFTARGSGSLIAARLAQGLSMGIANGTLSAAVIEAAPVHRKRVAAMLVSVAPMAGRTRSGRMYQFH
jgi:MFS family permease